MWAGRALACPTRQMRVTAGVGANSTDPEGTNIFGPRCKNDLNSRKTFFLESYSFEKLLLGDGDERNPQMTNNCSSINKIV